MLRAPLMCLALSLAGAGPAVAQLVPPASPGRIIQPLPPTEASGIMGRDVRSPDGQDMGRIVDVLVDQNGNPRAAVIVFGGFMGVGNRKIAVDWNALRFTPGVSNNPVTLLLSLNEIKAAPEYREDTGKAAAVVAPAAPMTNVAPAAPMSNVAPAAPPPNPAPAAPPAPTSN